MKTEVKETVKEILLNLHQLVIGAEDCISMLQTAFLCNSSTILRDCQPKVERIKKLEPQLTRELAEFARDNPDLKPYVSVPVHLLRIGEGVTILSEQIEKKIREKILCSPSAIDELTFLSQRLIEMLRPTADVILARNEILSKYVQESALGVERRATEYATQHEERLIEGVCLPLASALYITVLDAVKSIAWHAKEIARKLAG